MNTTFAIALGAAALIPGSVLAHEIILTPTMMDGTLRVSIDSSHVFVKPEELENVATLTATLVAPGGETDLTIVPEGDLTLMAESQAPDGAAWVVVHRLPLTFSNTPEGLVEGGRDLHPDANSVRLYEKYSKALVAGGDEAFVTTPLGHPLEVVPMSDLSTLSVGDELSVQVLHDGAPLAGASVEATYAGYSSEELAFVSTTAADDDGMATVAITEPGTWFVRVAYDADSTVEGIDVHILRAITSFDIE